MSSLRGANLRNNGQELHNLPVLFALEIQVAMLSSSRSNKSNSPTILNTTHKKQCGGVMVKNGMIDTFSRLLYIILDVRQLCDVLRSEMRSPMI